MQLLRTAMLSVLVAAAAAAQQVGDANRNYAIQGRGFGTASGGQSTITPTPGTMNNAYRTLDPYAPVIWARSNALDIGWNQTATNSIDLAPGGLEVVADGTAPNLASLVFRTNGQGELNLGVGVTEAVNGFHWYAMAHVAATSPDGLWVSNAVGCRMGGCLGIPQVLPLGDDDSVEVPLNSTIPWYGVSYPSIFVNSNGSVTFGTGDTEWSESVSGFLGGAPRIAMFWDDLAPNNGGEVAIHVSPPGSNIPFELCFSQVPEFPNFGGNSFLLRYYLESSFSWFFLAWGNLTSQDGLVGICPGQNQETIASPIDVTGPSTSIGSNAAVWEAFVPGSPPDLAGDDATFVLDLLGHPTQLQGY